MIELLKESPSEFEKVVTNTILEKVKKLMSGDDKAYDAFFQKTLTKFKVTDVNDLDKDKKKEFYDYIESNWESDDEDDEGNEGDDPDDDDEDD